MPNIHHNPLHAHAMRHTIFAIESGSLQAMSHGGPAGDSVLADEWEPTMDDEDEPVGLYFDQLQEDADQLRIRTKPRHARAQRTDRIR